MQPYDLDVWGSTESMMDELRELEPDYTIHADKVTMQAQVKIVFDFKKQVVHHYLTP